MEKSKKKNGKQWNRIDGPNLHPDEKERADKNKSIMVNDIFCKACKKTGVKITKRQASKWNNKKGSVYNNHIKKV